MKETLTKSITKYLKQTLPILNGYFSDKNKIVSSSRLENIITITTEKPHNFSLLSDDEALFVSGLKLAFDVLNIEIIENNVKITTAMPHNIGQDSILSLELIGFDEINGIYENQRKIIDPLCNEIFIPKSLFKSNNFLGDNRKIAIHIMRNGLKSCNRYLKKSDVEIINDNQFSYQIDEREKGSVFISNLETNSAYLNSLGNVIEVRDLQRGMDLLVLTENEDFRNNFIMVSRRDADASGNPDNKFGTNYNANASFHINETILISVLINTQDIKSENQGIINEIIENTTSDIINLMSQFTRFYKNKGDFKIENISYNGDSIVDIRDEKEMKTIFECQEIRFSVSKFIPIDKFSNLDQSFAFDGIQAFFSGVNTPIIKST